MGSGLVTNPPDEGTSLTPAADVPPESFLSAQDVANGAIGTAQKVLSDPLIQQLLGLAKTSPQVQILVFVAKNLGKFLEVIIQNAAPAVAEEAKALVDATTPLIAEVSDVFGVLAKAYVGEISRHYSMNKGADTTSTGTTTGNAASYAFDSIVAPIAFFSSGSDPTQDGAGMRNIQQTLGVIVQVHLATWVINVVSNLTGVGALKFMNSFNEVILAALNARALGRLAMKPYINTMITEPATAELNEKWPIKSPAASSDIKQYIRSGISSDQLQKNLSRLGYSPEVVAQLLLDTAHLMSPDDVGFVVRYGIWSFDQGVTYLQQQGYASVDANVVLFRAVNSIIYANLTRQADAMGAHYAAGDIEEDDYVSFLQALKFNDLEVASYKQVYGIEREFKKKLTYSQLQALYKAGLVDLDFVQTWLTKNQNSDSDSALLILLDFTTADELNARKAALAATARVQAVKEAAEAATATQKGEAALAAAIQAQSDAKAALAAKYGK